MIKTIHYLKYVIRRLLKVIPMVIGITFLTAFLVHISSDDPATMHFHDAGVPATQQMLDDFRQQHHLDQPFLQQYFIWGKDFIHGDFGVSYQDNQPVLQKIQTAAPYTVSIAINSMLLTLIVSIPIGIVSAYRKDSRFTKVINGIIQVGIALPSFIVGLAILYIFTSVFHVFAVLPKNSATGVIMPSLTIALVMSFRYIKQIQKITEDELQQKYIKGLRSRGISTISILTHTVLRNIMIEIITLTALSFGSLLGGVALVETVFNWPGLGKLLVDAVIVKDLPLLQAIVVILVILYVLIHFVADILYGMCNPKIRILGDEHEA